MNLTLNKLINGFYKEQHVPNKDKKAQESRIKQITWFKNAGFKKAAFVLSDIHYNNVIIKGNQNTAKTIYQDLTEAKKKIIKKNRLNEIVCEIDTNKFESTIQKFKTQVPNIKFETLEKSLRKIREESKKNSLWDRFKNYWTSILPVNYIFGWTNSLRLTNGRIIRVFKDKLEFWSKITDSLKIDVLKGTPLNFLTLGFYGSRFIVDVITIIKRMVSNRDKIRKEGFWHCLGLYLNEGRRKNRMLNDVFWFVVPVVTFLLTVFVPGFTPLMAGMILAAGYLFDVAHEAWKAYQAYKDLDREHRFIQKEMKKVQLQLNNTKDLTVEEKAKLLKQYSKLDKRSRELYAAKQRKIVEISFHLTFVTGLFVGMSILLFPPLFMPGAIIVLGCSLAMIANNLFGLSDMVTNFFQKKNTSPKIKEVTKIEIEIKNKNELEKTFKRIEQQQSPKEVQLEQRLSSLGTLNAAKKIMTNPEKAEEKDIKKIAQDVAEVIRSPETLFNLSCNKLPVEAHDKLPPKVQSKVVDRSNQGISKIKVEEIALKEVEKSIKSMKPTNNKTKVPSLFFEELPGNKVAAEKAFELVRNILESCQKKMKAQQLKEQGFFKSKEKSVRQPIHQLVNANNQAANQPKQIVVGNSKLG